ncbi:MAG: hypothetical protein C0453_01745 [Comamonadaceae bacterium]|nr:hypothetical protein [Comamonadaceae bacterium]
MRLSMSACIGSQNMENEDMEMLDYVESRTTRTLDYVRKSYDDLHERAYKLATLLVAGGGAMISYALAKVAPEVAPLTWAPVAALALSWFAIAGMLIWRGATTIKLSPGNGPKNLKGYFRARVAESSDELGALIITREAELDREQERLSGYLDGCCQRAEAIDWAYKTVAVVSPLTAVATAAICIWWF